MSKQIPRFLPPPSRLEVIRNQKRNIKALFKVESRIAVRAIISPQILVGELHAAANTLSNTIPLLINLSSKFEVYTAKMRAVLCVDGETPGDLENDVGESPGFERGVGGRRARVAVHGVALPHDYVTGGFHGGNVAGQVLLDFFRTVAGDYGDFAGDVVGVDDWGLA